MRALITRARRAVGTGAGGVTVTTRNMSGTAQFFGDGIARMRVAVARLPDCRADC